MYNYEIYTTQAHEEQYSLNSYIFNIEEPQRYQFMFDPILQRIHSNSRRGCVHAHLTCSAFILTI